MTEARSLGGGASAADVHGGGASDGPPGVVRFTARRDSRRARDPSPASHASAGSGGSRGTAGGPSRRQSHGVPSDRHYNGSDSDASVGHHSGLRGVGLRHAHGHGSPSPYLAPTAAAGGGVGLGGRVGSLVRTVSGAHAGGSSRAAATAAATRMVFESVPYPYDSDDDSGEYEGVVRPPPQRLFRVQPDLQAADRTTFGPARSLGGPARGPLAPHPPTLHGHAHGHAHGHGHGNTYAHTHQHLQALRRRQSGDDGVVGGTLLIGGGGGGGAGSGGFQERFAVELRRRDAERAALMQLLMAGNEEDLLRQDGDGGMLPAGPVELPARSHGAAAALALHALTRGSLLAGLGALAPGLVAEEPPAPTYEELLQLEDVRVTTPQRSAS
ncbi:hypothetical protein GPECTOR_17g947 [Gonium pectorale]|uniref:Uncharacterized protein n=1 Tax=Gonium pectorale TaxID=33097 RepID=A0A150GKK1_GONPE|nr:hypothetical protein GPECTOR_17g947 [Gonium pectorale]|eukprot:KXZ50308.1 hypothetical protein GPECTOR_17g947 [Gonium pectorale]